MAENGRETQLAARKIKALEILSLGGRVKAAANAAGVSERTINRWLADPTFRAELRRLEAEQLQRLGRRIMGLGELAAGALQDALGPGQPMAHRLRAADLVTSRGPQLAELAQIVARLEAIEKRLGTDEDAEDT